jgi:hypothetical protein
MVPSTIAVFVVKYSRLQRSSLASIHRQPASSHIATVNLTRRHHHCTRNRCPSPGDSQHEVTQVDCAFAHDCDLGLWISHGRRKGNDMMLVLNRGTAGCQLLAAGWNGTARYEPHTSPFPVWIPCSGAHALAHPAKSFDWPTAKMG